MAQKHKPAEHGQMRHTKNLGNHSVGDRYGGKPQQAHGCGKDVNAQRCDGQADENGNDDASRQINAREDFVFGENLSQTACGICTRNIEQTDQRQSGAGQLRRHALVFQKTGQVNADEHHLESADKVTRHQQLKTAVAKSLAQGLNNALVARRGLARSKAGFAQP